MGCALPFKERLQMSDCKNQLNIPLLANNCVQDSPKDNRDDAGEAQEQVIFMRTVSATISAAAAIPRDPYQGMFISLTGTLTHAARALRGMGEVPDCFDSRDSDDHDERCSQFQPVMRAYALEQLAKHIGMLKDALENGYDATVREFFEIYRFD
jgi:hypothetical protein